MEKLAPKRKSDVILKIFKSGEKILVDLKSRQTYKLNDVAVKMWSLFDGTHSIEDITNLIANEFDADTETINNDLKSFIDKLLQLGIIEM